MSTEQSAERLKVKDQSLPFAVCRLPFAVRRTHGTWKSEATH